MNGETLLLEITKPESRPDPYPLYAEARAARRLPAARRRLPRRQATARCRRCSTTPG